MAQNTTHSSWQNKLFYIVAGLIFYQMSIYAVTTLSCQYRFIIQDKSIVQESVCNTAATNTSAAVEKYITLLLALISKVPDDIVRPAKRQVIKKEEPTDRPPTD